MSRATGRRGDARTPPFAAVFFDCDSTLSAIEGIDELVGTLPPARRAALLALTEQAMNGALPLAEVYERRLQAIAPPRDAMAALGRRYVEAAVAGARPVVAALRHLGKRVGILSGGLLEPVTALAAHLGIDAALVHAVPLQFAADGSYRGFDRTCPLARNGGKAEVLRGLAPDHRPLAFVGDGVTDLEVQGAGADLFVGFGGVAVRPRVERDAEAWVAEPSLAPLLPLVLTPEEQEVLAKLPGFRSLVVRA